MFKRKTKKIPGRQRPTPSLQRNAGVFSYHAARSQRTDSAGRDTSQNNALDTRSKVQKHHKRSRRLLTVLAFIVLLGLGVNSVLVSPDPEISVVGDKAGQAFLQKVPIYAQAAARLMEDSALNRNKITFDTAGVSRQMLDQFPELAAVSVTHPLFGHRPVVHIQAFTPKLILVSDSGTFVLSSQGRAFLPGSKVPSMERFDLPAVRDQSGIAIREREIALPEREVAFISEVDRQLKTKKVEVSGYTLPQGGSELEVRIKGEPYKVRLNLYGNSREGVGRYLATREYLDSHGPVPDDYMDVRVDNHVYYR